MTEKASLIPGLAAGDVGDRGASDLLQYIDARHSTLEAELQALARHLYPGIRSIDASLAESSRLAFVTLCGYMFENYLEELDLDFPFRCYPTISAINRLICFVEADADTSNRNMLRHLMQRPFLAEWTRSGFSRLLQLSERRLSIVISSLSEGLRFAVRSSSDRLH